MRIRSMSCAAAGVKAALVLCILALSWLSSDNAGAQNVRLSELRWVVPSDELPEQVVPQAANNNVSIAFHEGRLFLAFRTAPTHFASPLAKMYIVSSPDYGKTWDFEHEISLKTDVREPYLLSFAGHLTLTFFEAGVNPFAFEPKRMWRAHRLSFGNWSPLETWGEEGEVPWDFCEHEGIVYRTSYIGNHYGLKHARIKLLFNLSLDGINWQPVGEEGAEVYIGGVSESAIEFDAQGNLYSVTRNEDGDSTGFGSHVAFAPSDDLSTWEFPDSSDKWRYDSPRLMRHGDDIYLLARRDIGGPYDRGHENLPFAAQRLLNLAEYSLRPKRTSLYYLDQNQRAVKWILDLPSAADTSFPSALQISPDSYLIANYTSPLCFKWRTWLAGQISPQGTAIYLIRLDFSN